MTAPKTQPAATRRIPFLGSALVTACLCSPALQAQQLSIVTSIPPVESIVQAVGGDSITSTLLIDGNVSPHTFNLRPSHLKRMSEADLVVWVGPGIEAFLPRAVEASGSADLSWQSLHADFEAAHDEEHHGEEHHGDEHADKEHHDDEHHGDEHADEEHHGDEHHGDEHTDEEHHGDEHHGDEHADEEHHGDEHAEEGNDDHHGHDHSGPDPHLWLAPGATAEFAFHVADALAELDPSSADTFRRNAEQFVSDLVAVDEELAQALALAAQKPVAVLHDAYPRFTAHYNLPEPITLTQLDEETPSASDVRRVADELRDLSISCVMIEPTTNPRWLNVLSTSDSTPTLQAIDPLGQGIPRGPELYFTLLRDISNAFQACSN